MTAPLAFNAPTGDRELIPTDRVRYLPTATTGIVICTAQGRVTWMDVDADMVLIDPLASLQRTELDLDYVTAQVRASGHPAHVEQTGGGCATVYAGLPDAQGRYPACAGPGWFTGRNFTRARASRDEMVVGPDGSDDPGTPTRTEGETVAAILALLTKVLS